jgi:hypothetical protein
VEYLGLAICSIKKNIKPVCGDVLNEYIADREDARNVLRISTHPGLSRLALEKMSAQ